MSTFHSNTILLLGSTGWIGGQLQGIFEKEGYKVVPSIQRLDAQSFDVFRREVDAHKPRAVISCAGLTGRPNVDWCEDHRHEVIRVNLIGTLALMEICEELKLHLISMATGCIFSYDDDHPEPFAEADRPNFDGSFYSLTKGMVDTLASNYKYTLALRLRMPISCDGHPRCFVTKIASYEKVVDIPNSMSVLHTLLPLVPRMVERDIRGGPLNFVNPGVISHNEILDMYKEYVNPEFTYTNFSEEDQSKILKAGRSNNALDTTRIVSLFPDLMDIRDAVRGAFVRASKGSKNGDLDSGLDETIVVRVPEIKE